MGSMAPAQESNEENELSSTQENESPCPTAAPRSRLVLIDTVLGLVPTPRARQSNQERSSLAWLTLIAQSQLCLAEGARFWPDVDV